MKRTVAVCFLVIFVSLDYQNLFWYKIVRKEQKKRHTKFPPFPVSLFFVVYSNGNLKVQFFVKRNYFLCVMENVKIIGE